VRPCRQHGRSIAALALALVTVGCSRLGTANGRAPSGSPIWAAQLAWAPSSASISLQYTSTNTSAPVDGAYDGTSSTFPGAGWQTFTWKLTQVHWNEKENFGADLRIAGAPGIAVHKVVLSVNPPGKGGPQASIRFDSQAIGALAAQNESQGLIQVGSGGTQGDSFYQAQQVDGKGADVLDGNGPGQGTSYIYLQLDHSSPVYTQDPSVVYATVTYTALHPAQPWSEATFAALAAKGIHRAEINMEWAAVEPAPGKFDFTLLDGDLANAAKAGVKVIPIFWYSVWSGNPASWITQNDVGSGGQASQVPVWWSASNRQAYFTYIKDTVAHIKGSPGFGGAFLDYGWLDYMWGPAPGGSGVNGYAPADVARFHRWLPTQYKSLAAFNRQYATTYTAWDQVPAAVPGQSLFAVYQQFRDWSVQETYSRMSAIYRQETAAPLYFYWGGGFGGFGLAFNVPDTFFQVAKRYHGTVVLDDADHTGLPLLFTSLARAYGVPLLEEWTPRPSGLHAEIAEFMGHYGFEFPENAGMDFFLYNGGKEYQVGFPVYTSAIPLLRQMRGAYPQMPVAVYLSYQSIFDQPSSLQGTQAELAAMWRRDPTGFTVVTSAELAAGVVHLSQFKAVLPLNGASDPAIEAYVRGGGHLVANTLAFQQYVPPFATFQPTTTEVELVPTVDGAQRTAWMTIAGISPNFSWSGNLTVDPTGLGLPAGSYHLVDLATGKSIPAEVAKGDLTVPLQVASGAFKVWKLEPGSGPTRAAQPQSSAVGAQVAYVAGQSGGGVVPLNITPAGGQPTGDGNVTLVQKAGESALETWTLQQLHTPGAYLYLQVNPSSAVYHATALDVTVTYLATPGQGFQVQYDGSGNAYATGPTVLSAGSGQWATSTVRLAGVALSEQENGGADLRLAVQDGNQPLYVHAVSIRAAAG
jgi:hypothetical protein